MTDKELLIKYLSRFQRAKARITELEKLRQRIEENAVTLKGIDTSSVKIQTSRLSDKVSAPILSAVSVDEQIERIRQRLPVLMNETEAVIKILPLDFQGWTVLYFHFLSDRKLSDIGNTISVSRSQVYVLYHNALDTLLNNSEVRERLINYKQWLIDKHKRHIQKNTNISG